MKRVIFAVALGLSARLGFADSDYGLRLEPSLSGPQTSPELSLTLTSVTEVQGLVAAFEWDGEVAEGVGLVPAAILDDADVVVSRVEPAYMVLGVVLDDDGDGVEVLPPGSDQLVATVALSLRCSGEAEQTEVRFADERYATVEGGPLLSNLVVVEGQSIGVAEGLELASATIRCSESRQGFFIDPAGASSASGGARVLMDNTEDVEGYVVSLCHDAAELELLDILPGEAATAQEADFTSLEIFPGGGYIGVVIDLVEPFTNHTIPPGEAQEIAVYLYDCRVALSPGDPPLRSPLTFCDGVFGDPPQENAIVVGGLSVAPALQDGEFVCLPPAAEEICDNGIDDDGDGLIDMADPDCADFPYPGRPRAYCGARRLGDDGLPVDPESSIGETTEVCLYLENPEDNAVGEIPQLDHLQGLSMALSFCCEASAADELDTTGTILEAIGAEYISVEADNDPDDDDGCELVIGVLVDALPPFDGATIPPTDYLQLLGCVSFTVGESASCGQPCPIEFTDGINGTGKIPVYNLASAENAAIPLAVVSCSLGVRERERFFRGDCNFSGGSGSDGRFAVNIADAAATVSFLFLPGPYKFHPPCLDACDCNDDGRIDLADVICVLRYLFQSGPFPLAPGPGYRETGQPSPNQVEPTGAGVDPTYDLLDCREGSRC